MAQLERYIGVDYSGAETPDSSCKGLRVYVAEGTRHAGTDSAAAQPEEVLDSAMSHRVAPRGTRRRHPHAGRHRPRLLVPDGLLRPSSPSPRLADLLGRFPATLADRRPRHLYRLHPRRWGRKRLEPDGRQQLAQPDRTMDGHREIRLPFRCSGGGRQIDVRRSALAPLPQEAVQAATPLLAVRRLGSSSGQVGRRGGLPLIVDAEVPKGSP